jgi:hypothetical protein
LGALISARIRAKESAPAKRADFRAADRTAGYVVRFSPPSFRYVSRIALLVMLVKKTTADFIAFAPIV